MDIMTYGHVWETWLINKSCAFTGQNSKIDNTVSLKFTYGKVGSIVHTGCT